MITILHITPSYKPAYVYGGPTFSVARLCEELSKTTFAVAVLTTNANGPVDLDVDTNKPIKIARVPVQYCKRITKDHSHFSPALIGKLISMIKEAKSAPNHQLIIHIHSWWNTVAIAAAMIGRAYNIPIVVSPRGTLTPYSMSNRNQLLKKLLHLFIGKPLLKGCHIHTTTLLEMDNLKEISVGYKGIHIIPNLLTFRNPHTPLQHTQAVTCPLKIMFLSRIEEKKGLNLLLKALSLLKIKWTLTIAGEGKLAYINYLTRYSIELNIYKNITWIDGIYGSAKFDYLKQHDILALPSYNENFANVVLESLSVGTAVIITKAVGLSEYVFKNRLGWPCTTDPANIAQVIETVASLSPERKRIRKESPNLIRADFQDKKLIAEYIRMYQNILDDES